MILNNNLKFFITFGKTKNITTFEVEEKKMSNNIIFFAVVYYTKKDGKKINLKMNIKFPNKFFLIYSLTSELLIIGGWLSSFSNQINHSTKIRNKDMK